MKDHEIVLKRERKLAEINRSVTGSNYANEEKKYTDPNLYRTILHHEVNNGRDNCG